MAATARDPLVHSPAAPRPTEAIKVRRVKWADAPRRLCLVLRSLLAVSVFARRHIGTFPRWRFTAKCPPSDRQLHGPMHSSVSLLSNRDFSPLYRDYRNRL